MLRPPELDEARDFERFVRWGFVASARRPHRSLRRLRPLRHAVREGVRGRPDRHRDAPRHARARARLARPASLRPRRALVAAPPRRLRARLRRVDRPRLVRPRRGVPLRLPRDPDRHGPRRPARGLVVDPGRGGLRRAGGALRVHLAVPDPGAARPAAPALHADADAWPSEQGLADIPVRVQEVGAWESPNAEATGLGPTRRVILWNTLVRQFRRRRGAGRARPRARPPLAQPPLEGRRLVRALRDPRRVSHRLGGQAPRRDARARGGPARACSSSSCSRLSPSRCRT